MSERSQALQFYEEGAPLQDEDLDAFENRVGVRFPAEYRAFLLAHNGGRVEPRTFGDEWDGTIQYFLSIGPPFDATYAWETFRHPDYPRMPPEHIPIAYCEGGNLLTIVVEGPHRGQIFYWDHEEEGDETYTYDNLRFVATSLDELLASLREPSL